MHMALHWTDKNVRHTIDFDSLVNDGDYGGKQYRVIVCNGSIDCRGVLMLGHFVKTVHVDIVAMVMNYKNIRANSQPHICLHVSP